MSAALVVTGVVVAAGSWAADPQPVGGQVVELGRISVVAPDGWFRATPEMEAEFEAWAFIYVSHSDDPELAEARQIVRIEREIDDFAAPVELETYYRNVESRLTASGWRRGELEIGGRPLACYRYTDDEETTYLVQIPFGATSVTTYTVQPKVQAGFPKSALRFLEQISVAPPGHGGSTPGP
jgi:hypothetical protein